MPALPYNPVERGGGFGVALAVDVEITARRQAVGRPRRLEMTSIGTPALVHRLAWVSHKTWSVLGITFGRVMQSGTARPKLRGSSAEPSACANIRSASLYDAPKKATFFGLRRLW